MVHIRDEGVFDAPLEKIWKYIGDDTPGLHKHRAIPSTKVLSEEGNVVVQEMQMLNADGKGTHWETWRLTMNPPRGYQVEAIAGPRRGRSSRRPTRRWATGPASTSRATGSCRAPTTRRS